MSTRTILLTVVALAMCCSTAAMALLATSSPVAETSRTLLAGASQVDITPQELPVIVSGGFLERTGNTVRDRLYARALIVDDGTSRVAICIVDILFMPRDLLDDAKHLASIKTGIRTENMLISATHTHTAASVAGALGTGVDEKYRRFLPSKIVEAIQLANDQLEPARIGWTAIDAPDHTHCRRWILRPDKIRQDVFGHPTVRANMHPGYQNPDFIGPAGPADTELSLLSVQSLQGRQLAILANYSMHYFGSSQVSADYFGRFADKFTELIDAGGVRPAFVAAMSQGTSGDLHWYDYSKPKESITIEQYSESLARLAVKAYKEIAYRDFCSLGMLERKLILHRRIPDKARLAWAKNMAEKMKRPKPASRPEVYALEQLCLHEDQVRELKLQVLRIGELGITAIPCEVYGITGLKIKAQSPLRHTFNIELANGSEGYIPPPEQHALGGYTTWPARSAALEVGAEPRIVETLLSMLEEVSGGKRHKLTPVLSDYDKAVLKSEPLAYWPLGEIQDRHAEDATENGNHGTYEDGVARYLPGPIGPAGSAVEEPSYCAHFAGGRMKARLPQLGCPYSVEMWIWNGLPGDVREFAGFIFSRSSEEQNEFGCDNLGIGGTLSNSAAKGKLIFAAANTEDDMLVGKSDLPLRTWNHIALVRDNESVLVYLNGNKTPEMRATVAKGGEPGANDLYIGGSSGGSFSFEGRIAKVAVFGRPLTPGEIASHYSAARSP